MKRSLSLRFLVILFLTSAFTFSMPVRPANAASFVVNTLDDVLDFDCNVAHCSLREAIYAANAASTDDTITFSVSGTIAPVGVLPAIVNASSAGALIIDGGGNITISGQNAGRVFWVNSGASLTLKNLTISGGSTTGDGGGVANFGVMTANSVAFSNNRAAGGGGIANFNGATLNVVNSTFSNNVATNGGGGLANYAGGVATVDNSAFTENSTDNNGGGLWNAGSLTVNNSAISANTALRGGGVANFGALSVSETTLDRNITIVSGEGGAMYNSGTATVIGSIIDANSAGYGGGIYTFDSSSVAVIKSTFVSNRAVLGGGGIYSTAASDVLVGNSTFAGNDAGTVGGGVANSATVTIVNSTFSGNGATTGGGVYVTGSATLQNTLIANSTRGGDCAGILSSATNNNLIEDHSSACGLTNGVHGNIIGQDPNLGALTGSPAYFPLNAGSAAIDAGDALVCFAPPVNNQAQNGVIRPQDGDGNGSAVCDIGSVEYVGAEPPFVKLFLPLTLRSS